MPKLSVRLIFSGIVFFGLVFAALFFEDSGRAGNRYTFIGLAIGSIFAIFSLIGVLRNKDRQGD